MACLSHARAALLAEYERLCEAQGAPEPFREAVPTTDDDHDCQWRKTLCKIIEELGYGSPLQRIADLKRRAGSPETEQAGGSIPSPYATPTCTCSGTAAQAIQCRAHNGPRTVPSRFDMPEPTHITAERVRNIRAVYGLSGADDWSEALSHFAVEVLRGLLDHPGVSSSARAVIEAALA